MPLDEAWSWGKFFTGFISGKNYAKAVVMMFCMAVIITIIFCVGSVVKAKLLKQPRPTQTVGANQGIIATNNEDKQGNSYSLLNFFNWR